MRFVPSGRQYSAALGDAVLVSGSASSCMANALRRLADAPPCLACARDESWLTAKDVLA
jgi:hypothetical protein